MLREYALDPALLRCLNTREKIALFKALFESSTLRRASAYPSVDEWVATAVRGMDEERSAGPHNFTAAACIPDLVQSLKRLMLRGRPRAPFKPDLSWLANAIAEHEVARFARIVSDEESGHRRVRDVVSLGGLFDETIGEGSQVEVQRDPEILADNMTPLLRNAKDVIIVDPYAVPSGTDFVGTLRAIARRVSGEPARRLSIVCRAPRSKGELCDERASAEKVLGTMDELAIDRSWCFVERLPHRRDWQMHDRFLLTDVGGVISGGGFDSSGAKTVLTLMNLSLLDQKRREFGPDLGRYARVHRVCVPDKAPVPEKRRLPIK